ncbi:riboflavin biosynthesis protein RibD [Lachnospiraceae bacterium]|nr:riboflavin biosynthesis protein RibD [Lachnospiraceae bacterium]
MRPEDYMMLAVEEAKKGEGFTNPNPMVGAVLVKDGRIVGRDYHHKYGEYHAERNAIVHCGEDLDGAELYVTLEPCCHYGKTPPCTEIILESGIQTVYIGSMDPNPLVAGKGAEILRRHGIEVITGICEDECRKLNRVFFHYIRSKTPYVVMKYAMTADGKIATKTGASKWITGEAARERVHKSRHQYMGIMVGVGTVLADDPKLTCRLKGKRSPVRIVCDTNLRTPLASALVRTAKETPVILATAVRDEETIRPYREAGCRVLEVPLEQKHINLQILMQKLGELGIDSILLEGGAELNYSALKSGIVQAVDMYVAPKLFGGFGAKTPVAGEGVNFPQEAFVLCEPRIEQIGEDILIQWEVKPCLRES